MACCGSSAIDFEIPPRLDDLAKLEEAEEEDGDGPRSALLRSMDSLKKVVEASSVLGAWFLGARHRPAVRA